MPSLFYDLSPSNPLIWKDHTSAVHQLYIWSAGKYILALLTVQISKTVLKERSNTCLYTTIKFSQISVKEKPEGKKKYISVISAPFASFHFT